MKSNGLTETLVKTVLDSMPFAVFLVDGTFEVAALNQAASQFAGPYAPKTLRKRTGEVLHCLQAMASDGGCGTAANCSDCLVRRSISAAVKGKRVVRERTEMELVDDGTPRRVQLLVTSAPMEIGPDTAALLIVEDITELADLRSLLPICSYCKKIRNDQQYWERLEAYLSTHLDVDFTHGICPDCVAEHFPQLAAHRDKSYQ